MLEYSYDEAEGLLATNLENARGKLQQAIDDLSFVRDQTIITEVNIARVYNFNVRQRRLVRLVMISVELSHAFFINSPYRKSRQGQQLSPRTNTSY